jgi:hypothetical protein
VHLRFARRNRILCLSLCRQDPSSRISTLTFHQNELLPRRYISAHNPSVYFTKSWSDLRSPGRGLFAYANTAKGVTIITTRQQPIEASRILYRLEPVELCEDHNQCLEELDSSFYTTDMCIPPLGGKEVIGNATVCNAYMHIRCRRSL